VTFGFLGYWYGTSKVQRQSSQSTAKKRRLTMADKFSNFHVKAFMSVTKCSYTQAVIAWETYFEQSMVSPACFVGNWMKKWSEQTIEDFMVVK